MQRLERVSTAELVEDQYFSSNPVPKECVAESKLAELFIEEHAAAKRRVILVTSGGTTVPLENQTVRFIDNFSAGTRGATSAEYFLEAGYAVIFLHRHFSLLPYSRHFSHSTNCFLDFMAEDSQGEVVVQHGYQDKMREVLRKYTQARKENTLLLLSYTTITEYLWLLRAIAISMQPLGATAAFYLAAAVSDFFVPKDRLSEHKIQSGNVDNDGSRISAGNKNASIPPHLAGNKLVIDLDPVPKFLKRLVGGWAPEAMVVSFKLETDPELLISKARMALERYSHRLVIGNLLVTRSWEVVFVAPGQQERWIRIPLQNRGTSATSQEAAPNAGKDSVMEIESLIVPEVIQLHDKHIESA